jgi:FAD synthase
MVTEGGLIVLVKLLQELKRENLSSLKKEHQKDKKNQKQILKNLLLLPPQQKHKAAQALAPQPQAAPEPAPEDQSQEVPPLTIVFGRFNPPTVGHDKLLKSAKEYLLVEMLRYIHQELKIQRRTHWILI